MEIERKFLVHAEKWEQVTKAKGIFYRQGYIVNDNNKTVRVRASDKNGFITIKSGSKEMSRKEYDYEIPVTDAREMLENFAGAIIEKTRFVIMFAGKKWEIDEFSGENKGLIIAEIELTSESEQVELPEWIAVEVTADQKYYNSYISEHPYKNW